MLQALARKRSAPSRATTQETLTARIAKRPDQIADALETEHRIVDEERNHLHLVVGVGGARRRERRHGAGFGDAFLQNLPVLRFLVIQEHFGVVRLVELSLAGVDAELPEER